VTLDVHRTRDARRAVGCRVLLDGRDVTSYCWKADSRRGRVWLYLRDLTGRIIVHPDPLGGCVIPYERRGRVRIMLAKS